MKNYCKTLKCYKKSRFPNRRILHPDFQQKNSRGEFQDSPIIPRKSLGQHFCRNPKALETVVHRLKIQPHHEVWEIGPGLGALTKYLSEVSGKLRLFEIDIRFRSHLESLFITDPPLDIVWGDFLKAEIDSLNPGKRNLLVCGNLPFYCGAAIVKRVLGLNPAPQRMVFVLQKEVARKACSLPGSEEYVFFSAAVQLFSEVIYGPEFPPHFFSPDPHISCALVEFVPFELSPSELKLRLQAKHLASVILAHRRKLAISLLQNSFPNVSPSWLERFEKLHISPKIRGEEIGLDLLIELSI